MSAYATLSALIAGPVRDGFYRQGSVDLLMPEKITADSPEGTQFYSHSIVAGGFPEIS
jgi:hypothetical protein